MPLKGRALTGYTLPSRSDLPFLISDIPALWRSALIIRVPEYQKLTRQCVNNINDVLPLKAARRYAIANFKCCWGLGHQIPNFDGYIYIQYVAPPYSARISAMYFLPFGNVWLGSVSACNAWEAQ